MARQSQRHIVYNRIQLLTLLPSFHLISPHPPPHRLPAHQSLPLPPRLPIPLLVEGDASSAPLQIPHCLASGVILQKQAPSDTAAEADVGAACVVLADEGGKSPVRGDEEAYDVDGIFRLVGSDYACGGPGHQLVLVQLLPFGVPWRVASS